MATICTILSCAWINPGMSEEGPQQLPNSSSIFWMQLNMLNRINRRPWGGSFVSLRETSDLKMKQAKTTSASVGEVQQKGLGAAKFQEWGGSLRRTCLLELWLGWHLKRKSFANHRTQSSWELFQWLRFCWCPNKVMVDNRDVVIPWYHQNLQNHTSHLPET